MIYDESMLNPEVSINGLLKLKSVNLLKCCILFCITMQRCLLQCMCVCTLLFPVSEIPLMPFVWDINWNAWSSAWEQVMSQQRTGGLKD